MPLTWYTQTTATLDTTSRVELLVQRFCVELAKARNGRNVSLSAVATNADPKTSHHTLPVCIMGPEGEILSPLLPSGQIMTSGDDNTEPARQEHNDPRLRNSLGRSGDPSEGGKRQTDHGCCKRNDAFQCFIHVDVSSSLPHER